MRAVRLRSPANGVYVGTERTGVLEFVEHGDREPDVLADWRGPRGWQRIGSCERCWCVGECMARVIALQPFALERCNAPMTLQRRFLAAGWARWLVVRACLLAAGRPLAVSEVERETGMDGKKIYTCLRQAVAAGVARQVEVRQDGMRHYNLYEAVSDGVDPSAGDPAWLEESDGANPCG